MRIDNDLDRTHEDVAGRIDFNYRLHDNPITSVDVGARWSELSYFDQTASAGGTGTEDHRITLEPERLSGGSGETLAALASCQTDFPETGFLSALYSGNIFTVNGDDPTVNASASGNTFATLDNNCFNATILSAFGLSGSNLSDIDFPELTTGITTSDITETTIAGYVKANYETSYNGLPIRGNVGLRVVNTDVDSIGFRANQTIVDNGDGTFSLDTDSDTLIADEAGSSYTEFLPSFNLIVDVNDDVLVRGAIFRGLSRIDPSDLNNRRLLSVNNDENENGATSIEDLLGDPTAFGNPDADPLASWNFDAAVEWYPNADSILTLGGYYKRFTGGLETLQTTETFNIDGQDVTLPINVQQVNDEASDLFGLEVSLAHRFSYLPGALSGLGVKAGYNFADSNFEFNDSDLGAAGIRDADGNFTQTAVGIVAPANVPGFSRNVFSGQIYYQIGEFDIAGIVKHRSRYFQPFTTDGTVLRFVDAATVFEAKASYKLNDNFKLSFQAINLLNEERRDTFRTTENFGQANVYGPRIFFGVKGIF